MKKYIYANLKTNLTGGALEQYLDQVEAASPFTNLPMVFVNHLYILEMYHRHGGQYLGVQSFNTNEMGAYTSSVSYQQLAAEGITNVLLGHSEEMKYFDLTLDDVNCQLKLALENGFHPVVCFGEEENESLVQRITEVEDQLQIILNEVEDLGNVILSYEPKWAIGGQQAIDPAAVLPLIQSFKTFIYDRFGQEARIIYGGSVKLTNIHALLDNEIVDGVLVGSAALNVETYLKMVQDPYA